MYNPAPATRTIGTTTLAVCCLLLILLLLVGTIVLALIPVYLSTRNITPNNNPRQRSLFGTYASNLANGRSRTLASSSPDGTQLLQAARLKNSQVTARTRGFIPATAQNGRKRQTLTGNPVCERPTSLTGDIYVPEFVIIFPSSCLSTDCQDRFLANIENSLRIDYQVITVTMNFIDGQSQSVELQFCSFFTSVSIGGTTNTTTSATNSTTSSSGVSSSSVTSSSVTSSGVTATGVPSSTDCIDATRNFVYFLQVGGALYQFSPTTFNLTQVGFINCSASSTPLTIAPQRNGLIWVFQLDGGLYNYNITTGQCTPTNFVRNQTDISLFTMAFVKNNNSTDNNETLYISKHNGGGGVLGTIDLNTLTVSIVGNYSSGFYEADLAGTNDGGLMAYFYDTKDIITLVNKENANIIVQYPLDSAFNLSQLSFSIFPYSTNFFLIIGYANYTTIGIFDPVTNTSIIVETVPETFFSYPGVSTCLGT